MLRQNPYDSPTSWEKRRGRNPTFASRDKWARIEAAQRNLGWLWAYKAALDAWRDDVRWPGFVSKSRLGEIKGPHHRGDAELATEAYEVLPGLCRVGPPIRFCMPTPTWNPRRGGRDANSIEAVLPHRRHPKLRRPQDRHSVLVAMDNVDKVPWNPVENDLHLPLRRDSRDPRFG